MSRHFRFWLFVTVFNFGAVASTQSLIAEHNSSYSAALESMTEDELYHDVEVLADDVYEGRAAGSRGGHAAAQWLLRRIEPLRLTPASVQGEFVQSFNDDCRNILALLPGDDPKLHEEVILVGAHYDHVGYGNNNNSFGPTGKIHNGADDNASGISVLLEVMKAFSHSGLKTRRTILFAFWDSEERGMVGSRYWLAHPTLSVDRVKLSITLDMVGRLRDQALCVLGTRSGYGLRRLFADTCNENLSLNFLWDIRANSDHWPFLEHEIPIALLHTGLHSDYHRPSDDVEKINPQGMKKVGRFLLATIVRAANEDHLPRFRYAVRRETESLRRSMEKPLPPASLMDWPEDEPRPRLGISWREDEAEPGSIFLVRVVDGSPAATAGLQLGDRIYELNGQPFSDGAEFQIKIKHLLEARRQNVKLLSERQGRIQIALVKLQPSAN